MPLQEVMVIIMKRIAQSATEYMFMLAISLALVALAFEIVIRTMKTLTDLVSKYIEQTRKEILENL